MTAKLMHHQSYSWTPGARQHSTGPHKEGRKPIRRLLSAEVLVCLAALLPIVGTPPLAVSDWRQFRGPDAASTAMLDSQLPQSWSAETGENIAWLANLPGQGVSSPIVVDGRVIVTCSSGTGRNRLHVLAFDSATGKELWHRKFWATGRSFCHPTSANAAPTPASNGQQVFAFFSSNDLVCLDLDGNLQWIRGLALDYPKVGNDVGMSSSPVVLDNLVVIQSESQGDSFVEALDCRDGSQVWHRPRPQQANWTSPVGIVHDSGSQVLLTNAQGVQLLDAKSGKLQWEWEGECGLIPSPTVNHWLVVPSNGLATWNQVKPGEFELVWQENRLKTRTVSPVLTGDQVYVISGNVVSCGDLSAKEIAWKKRLGGSFWSTPVLAGHYLYCFNTDGTAYVMDVDAKGKIVAENELGEGIWGSPAVADNAIYVRSHNHLWKIAESSPPPPAGN